MRHESWKLNFSKPYVGAPTYLIVAEQPALRLFDIPPSSQAVNRC